GGSDPATQHARRRRRRWSWVGAAAVAVAVACGAFVACQLRGETTPSAVDPQAFTLEATPAGTDSSGAILLRIRLVYKPWGGGPGGPARRGPRNPPVVESALRNAAHASIGASYRTSGTPLRSLTGGIGGRPPPRRRAHRPAPCCLCTWH